MTRLLVVLDNWKTSVRRLEQQSRQVRQTLPRRYRYHWTMHDVTGLEQLQVQPDTDRLLLLTVGKRIIITVMSRCSHYERGPTDYTTHSTMHVALNTVNVDKNSAHTIQKLRRF